MADDALGLCLPGLADEFHIVADSTHAAFGARLNTVVGYAESETTSCSTFSACGEFPKSTHTDLERALDGATGGAFYWSTKTDVLATQNQQSRCWTKLRVALPPIGFCLPSADCNVASWWAQG